MGLRYTGTAGRRPRHPNQVDHRAISGRLVRRRSRGKGRKQWRRVAVWIVVGVTILGVLLGVLIGVLARNRHVLPRQHTVSAAGFTVAVASLVFAAAIWVATIWLAARRGQLRFNRSSPLWALPFKERRRIGRQMRGREPHTLEEVPFLEANLTIALAQKWVIWILVGSVIAFVGSTASQQTAFRWFAGAYGGVLGFAVFLLWFQFHRMEASAARLTETATQAS